MEVTATHINHADFTGSEAEIEEMRRLVIKNYKVSLKPFSMRLSLLENWFYASRYLEPPEYFTGRVHLWRSAAGNLLAFVIRGTSFHNLQVDYQHRYLEPEILDWCDLTPIGEAGKIGTKIYNWDIERQKLAGERGFQNQGAIEDVRIYDLSRSYPLPVLPPDYRFASVAALKDDAARIDLENRVWDASVDEAWFRGKSSAPSYSADWDIVVVSPAGKLAAYNLVWPYPDNQSAEIDPLGTHPDFRKLGLARALVLESFRRLREHNYRYVYIASETQDPIVRQLYQSFQPVELYQGFHWVKDLAQPSDAAR